VASEAELALRFVVAGVHPHRERTHTGVLVRESQLGVCGEKRSSALGDDPVEHGAIGRMRVDRSDQPVAPKKPRPRCARAEQLGFGDEQAPHALVELGIGGHAATI
jgi:hypothetical protein